MKKVILALALLAGTANAAVWERPAGGYTPTNHSINTTKYQTDRANNVAISSVKVDGDINKAFEGLNNIETRTAPSVVGQGGKFLTNDGSQTAWGLILPNSISSSVLPSGYVLKADGSGATSFGLLDTTSFPNNGVAGTYVAPQITLNTAGLVTSVTAPITVSATNLYASGTLTVSGTSNLGLVSATDFTGNSGLMVVRGWATLQPGNVLRRGGNIASVVKTATGVYGVSFTTPVASTYLVVGNSGHSNNPNFNLAAFSRTSTGFIVRTGQPGVSTATDNDTNDFIVMY